MHKKVYYSYKSLICTKIFFLKEGVLKIRVKQCANYTWVNMLNFLYSNSESNTWLSKIVRNSWMSAYWIITHSLIILKGGKEGKLRLAHHLEAFPPGKEKKPVDFFWTEITIFRRQNEIVGFTCICLLKKKIIIRKEISGLFQKFLCRVKK